MKTVFLGDSLTDWNSKLRFVKNSENYGVAGFTTTDVIWQLKGDEEEIISGDKTILMIGINDLMNNLDPDRIVLNIENIIETLKKRFREIYLISILPIDNLKINDKVIYINDKLKNKKDFIFLDFYQSFTDKNGIIKRAYTTDGAHLSNEGYKVFNKLLEDKGDVKFLEN